MRAAVLALALLAVASTPSAFAADDEASYEFLSRQGQLLFDYGKFDEATVAFSDACATPEGGADFECWRKLATSAERAGRIGIAIDAWASALDLPGEEAAVAKREWQRLRGTFGAVLLEPAEGRELPTVAGVLVHTGLLIDPALKAHVATVAERAAEGGFDTDLLWLPPGSYTFDGFPFDVEAGSEIVVSLPPKLVPWRSAAFRGADAGPLSPEGGPWSVGADVQLGMGGAPGGGLGLGPMGFGMQVRLGRRFGPVRIEGRGRFGGTPTATSTDADDRAGSALHILGQLDVGLDLAPAPALRLTPHAGFVGGTLGAMLVGCRAEASADAFVYDGECRVGSLAAGGQAGLDLLILPRTKLGRVGIRIGVFGEALAGGVMAVPGQAFGGDLDMVIVKLERWRFVALKGGLDVGISLRF
ncbi:MAG: hypothetical protein GY898_02170 [Proteobacteria bacterium]|nr:hypothetical protein [Pseudomonadota bacterium]